MDLVHYNRQTEKQFLDRYKVELVKDPDVKEGLRLFGNLLKGVQFSDKHRTITKLMDMLDPQLANIMNSNGQETPLDQS